MVYYIKRFIMVYVEEDGELKMSKKKQNSILSQMDKKNNILGWMSGVAVLIIFCLQPVVFDNYYFNLLESKYRFYWISMLIFVVASMAVWVYFYNGDSVEQINKQKWWKRLSVTDWAMAAFVLVSVLSTIFSNYRYESLWGNEGRFNGLFLTLIYGAVYVWVTRYFRFKIAYLDSFLAVAGFVCLFGITDYFGMDMLGFKENMSEGQLALFTSTLGNINTYTAYVGMVLGVAAALFVTSKVWAKMVFYYVIMVIGFFAIIMGTSDNAYLALGALFAFLPCFLFQSKQGIKRYMVTVSSFFTVIQCIDWINTAMPDKVFGIEGLFSVIAQHRYLLYVVVVLWAITAALYIADHTSESEEDYIGNWLRNIWWILLIAVAILVIYVLYDANIAGNAQRYEALSNYLVFNDAWGNYRGVAWRLGLEEYAKFPFYQKLIGYGPDTFGILLIKNRGSEMTSIGAQIYDSAHNEYIQYLITLGALGLGAYLTLVTSAIVTMVKRVKKSPYVLAVIFAMACYLAQAAVNINLPITTPIFMMFLMVGFAKRREE